MIEVQGKYNTAKVFTDTAEASAVAQIQHLLDQPFVEGSQIRIMPDTHYGMGCPVGLTMTITDKIVPNFVGVDISCGMQTAILKDKRIDFNQFDKAVQQCIPAGFKVRTTPHDYADYFDLTALRCVKHVDTNRALLSIGTLGGGNHFIEVGQDDDGVLYIIVHSGSRNLGKQVCEYYQNAAADALGRKDDGADRVLAYVEGSLMDDYLHDMEIVQQFAYINRKAIIKDLTERVKHQVVDTFATVHNYIDDETMILRKGAISAQKDERLLMPMNMRDGSLLCVGKGNPDWNYSAPHGAGRVMSRKEAKEKITLSEYKKTMNGIFSTSVSRATIDEAPQAYKPMSEVVANSSETFDVVKSIKPLYNFKAGQD